MWVALCSGVAFCVAECHGRQCGTCACVHSSRGLGPLLELNDRGAASCSLAPARHSHAGAPGEPRGSDFGTPICTARMAMALGGAARGRANANICINGCGAWPWARAARAGGGACAFRDPQPVRSGICRPVDLQYTSGCIRQCDYAAFAAAEERELQRDRTALIRAASTSNPIHIQSCNFD